MNSINEKQKEDRKHVAETCRRPHWVCDVLFIGHALPSSFPASSVRKGHRRCPTHSQTPCWEGILCRTKAKFGNLCFICFSFSSIKLLYLFHSWKVASLIFRSQGNSEKSATIVRKRFPGVWDGVSQGTKRWEKDKIRKDEIRKDETR